MIDYNELLIKYIAHIIDQEGIDYTDRFNDVGHTVSLTDEEITEMEYLAKQARELYTNK